MHVQLTLIVQDGVTSLNLELVLDPNGTATVQQTARFLFNRQEEIVSVSADFFLGGPTSAEYAPVIRSLDATAFIIGGSITVEKLGEISP